MSHRELELHSFADVIAEIERLRDAGYERSGNWSLGQICQHLNYYHRGSLEGFGFKLPWLLRYFLGGPTLRKWFRDGKMKPNGATVNASKPADSVDEDVEIDECLDLLRRLETAEQLHPSPMFGDLSIEDWQRLHVIHAANHLGYLSPPSET